MSKIQNPFSELSMRKRKVKTNCPLCNRLSDVELSQNTIPFVTVSCPNCIRYAAKVDFFEEFDDAEHAYLLSANLRHTQENMTVHLMSVKNASEIIWEEKRTESDDKSMAFLLWFYDQKQPDFRGLRDYVDLPAIAYCKDSEDLKRIMNLALTQGYMESIDGKYKPTVEGMKFSQTVRERLIHSKTVFQNGKSEPPARAVRGENATEVEMVQDIKKHMSVEQKESAEKSRMVNIEKQHKVFISHSSKDKDYMQVLVELMEDIGLPEGSIVCSSVPGYGIPGGAKIYEWLREQFLQCDLHVIFALSHNYYQSAASLNEMGAAWLTKAEDTPVVLPGFAFSDVRGCIDKDTLGIDLGGDEDELKHRLGELKDTLVSEFNLTPVSGTKWERHRNEFIGKVNGITAKRKDTAQSEKSQADTEVHLSEEDINRIAEKAAPKWETFGETSDSVKKGQMLSCDAMILLAYASSDGEIMVIASLGGTSVSASRWNFVKIQNRREIARWEDAVDELLRAGFIKRVGKKDKIYNVTTDGYKVADAVINENGIDLEKSPDEYLKD